MYLYEYAYPCICKYITRGMCNVMHQVISTQIATQINWNKRAALTTSNRGPDEGRPKAGQNNLLCTQHAQVCVSVLQCVAVCCSVL